MSTMKNFEFIGIVIAASWILGSTVVGKSPSSSFFRRHCRIGNQAKSLRYKCRAVANLVYIDVILLYCPI